MNIKTVTFALLASLAFLGCERPSEVADGEQGWHFQGRDCLACHNVDLGEDKHLLFAGTLYKESNVTDQDNIENTCGGEFVVNFLDKDLNTIFSSKNYYDNNSKGNDAKGNLFVLQRANPNLSEGSYYIQITDKNSNILAISSSPSHAFNLQPYDLKNPQSYENRVACNSCHNSSGGSQPPLYVQINQNLCK